MLRDYCEWHAVTMPMSFRLSTITRSAIWLPACVVSRQRPQLAVRLASFRLAKMLCTLLSLIQIFVPDAAALAADIQARALVLSCGVFVFIVYRVLRDEPLPTKAYEFGS